MRTLFKSSRHISIQECTICLSTMNTAYTLKRCKHKFHKQCLRNHVNTNAKGGQKKCCPICRCEFDPAQHYHLILNSYSDTILHVRYGDTISVVALGYSNGNALGTLLKSEHVQVKHIVQRMLFDEFMMRVKADDERIAEDTFENILNIAQCRFEPRNWHSAFLEHDVPPPFVVDFRDDGLFLQEEQLLISQQKLLKWAKMQSFLTIDGASVRRSPHASNIQDHQVQDH
jgi:hypothetical protein